LGQKADEKQFNIGTNHRLNRPLLAHPKGREMKIYNLIILFFIVGLIWLAGSPVLFLTSSVAPQRIIHLFVEYEAELPVLSKLILPYITWGRMIALFVLVSIISSLFYFYIPNAKRKILSLLLLFCAWQIFLFIIFMAFILPIFPIPDFSF